MRFATNARGTLALAPLLLATAAVVLTASGALAATNLIANGTFEGKGTGSLSGWGGSSGALSLVTGNGSGHAAQLKASSGASQTYAYTTSKPVTNAAAGATYHLDGQVQSAVVGQTVCLVLKELKAGTQTSVGSGQSCTAVTSTWQNFATVNYTIKTGGDSLTVNVLEKPAVAGATYSFDNIALTTGTVTPPDTQAPSVPGGVGAVANSSSSVTVSWLPSSDNVGVVGYDVFRGGVKVMTVGGSTTSWTDSGLSPSTMYSYTVDAFDAVPNTSAQSTPPASVTTPPTSTSGPAEPIVVIVMENKPYSDIVGSSSAPYIQSMIANGTLYTNYQAAPGSLPDYLAMTSGLTGSTSGSNNLFNQLQSAGISWGEYEESMPSNCFTGADTGSYKKGHNPAVYYNDIVTSPTACANVMPYSSFSPSHLRSFSYVVPNLTDDMHDGSGHAVQIANGDSWLAANVPPMLNAGAEVILTWDEGNSADEHVATIAIGGGAGKGVTNSQLYTHPGLLAGLEDAWGFARLNSAVGANPFPIS